MSLRLESLMPQRKKYNGARMEGWGRVGITPRALLQSFNNAPQSLPLSDHGNRARSITALDAQKCAFQAASTGASDANSGEYFWRGSIRGGHGAKGLHARRVSCVCTAD